MVERGDGGFAGARWRQQQHAIVHRQRDQRHLHLAVHVEQRGGAALTGPERGDVIGQQRMQELRTIAAGDLDETEIRAIDESDGVARGVIVGEALVAWLHGVHCTRRVLDCAPCRRRSPS